MVHNMELQINNLSKGYGRRAPYCLQDICLTLQPGIVGLLGPNGAGKSTIKKFNRFLIMTFSCQNGSPTYQAVYETGK